MTGHLNPSIPPIWDRDPVEAVYANNTFTRTVTFEAVGPLDLVIYRVGYELDGTSYAPPHSHPDRLVDWIKRAYPISSINVWKRYCFYGEASLKPDGSLKKPNCHKVNRRLWWKRRYDLNHGTGIPWRARYYGMVDDGGGFMRGCARGIPSHVASGPTGTYDWGWDYDGCYGDWYGGHELGHTYGRWHAMFCGAAGGLPYPHKWGRISPAETGNEAIYGFDIDSFQIYGPTWKDLMTYCDWIWLSDFTYEGLMDFFRMWLTAASSERPAVNRGDHLLVSGSIDPTTGDAELDPMFVIPDASEVEERIPGEYEIVLRGSDGSQLARYPFTPYGMEDGRPWPGGGYDGVGLLTISEMVPYVQGTTRVEVVRHGEVYAHVVAGPSCPTVNILSPNGGEILTGAQISRTIRASDPDGDPLFLNTEYSADGGASWELVAQSSGALTGTHSITGTVVLAAMTVTETVELDAVNIPAGTKAYFRVWASDGIHTSSDTSDAPFTVLNHIPTVEITEPEGPVTVAVSQTLTLEGNAYDIDTGSMSGEQLQWLSNLGGVLGNGDLLSIVGLSEGMHTITFRADDGDGGVAEDTVAVTVVADVLQLPPVPDKLLAGPSPITFDPAGFHTSASLSIQNQKVLNPVGWSAGANEPWLQLSRASGTTPDQVTVSVDDAGLSLGIYTDTITVISPDLPGESVAIHVRAEIVCALRLPLLLQG